MRQQTELMDHTLGQDFSSFTMTGMKTSNLDALDQDLTQSYTVTAPQYARAMGQLLLVRPRVLGSDSFTLDRKPRVYDIDLKQTETVTDEFDVELPPGYTVDEVPDPVSVDVGFANYKSSSELKGNMLRYIRTYTLSQVQLEPGKYSDLQRLVGAIAADERGQAILKKAN